MREFANVNEGLPEGNADRQIDSEGAHGGATALCPSLKNGAMPAEMAFPILSARIEKADDISRLWIDAGEIRALVQVAWNASVGAILVSVRTAMDPSDDMVELKRQVIMLLRHLAIFAAMMRALTDQGSGSSIHEIESSSCFLGFPAELRFQDGKQVADMNVPLQFNFLLGRQSARAGLGG